MDYAEGGLCGTCWSLARWAAGFPNAISDGGNHKSSARFIGITHKVLLTGRPEIRMYELFLTLEQEYQTSQFCPQAERSHSLD